MLTDFIQKLRLGSKPVILAAALAVAMVGLPTAIYGASEGNEEAREAFAKAEQFRAKRDIRSARIELMNAIKADPEWIDARVAQAEVLLGLRDGAGAEAELDWAVQLGLDPAAVRHLYGHAYSLQGEAQKARDQLLTNDIPPKNQGYAARIMGKVALQMGDEQLAGAAYNRAMELDGQNPDLWVDIARFRSRSGDQAGATNAVDEAVKLDPANIRALQYRGELLRFQFGLGAALPWFERALELDPNDVPLLTEYAATLGDMGRMTDMLVVARKIIALDGKNPRAFFNMPKAITMRLWTSFNVWSRSSRTTGRRKTCWRGRSILRAVRLMRWTCSNRRSIGAEPPLTPCGWRAARWNRLTSAVRPPA
jgi:tetratricopeptide (TPR) repeat protein